MEAVIGDKICIHGNVVGHADRNGEIIEVHGDKGEPPYVVRFEDGHTRLVYPGPAEATVSPRPLLWADLPTAARRTDPASLRARWLHGSG